MTLRQRAADRAKFVAWLIETAMYIVSHPELDEVLEDAGPLQFTFDVRSKVEADEIIHAYGARSLWRNGYYMAEWKLDAPSGEERKLLSRLISKLLPRNADMGLMAAAGRLADEEATFELHFSPPIFAGAVG